MWLLASVLILLGSSTVIAGLDDHVLPPMARWCWWTANLLTCGLAAIYANYATFWWKAVGLVSVTLFYLSYPLLWDTYLSMIPDTPAGFPWPDVFVVANVVLPIILVTIGLVRPVVRMGG